MVDRGLLLKDLQGVLKTIEADLLERSGTLEEVRDRLLDQYELAKKQTRTALSFEEWRSDTIMHIGAAWVLAGVFVRFLEDNELVEVPRIAGTGERLGRARDEHELYFQQHPRETDREYWLDVFDGLARLPGADEVFGERLPLREYPTWLSGDAAGVLLQFFQRVDATTGELVHEFEGWNTRFLGDLYQDLSERARKKYALLQTPEFVEKFILDRTLEPAIDTFRSEFLAGEFRMIDPACGSGHFLLGSFERILGHWRRIEKSNDRVLVQRALDAVHGVDVNPFAVSVARFRLWVVALWECGIKKLKDAPDFRLNLACGDSLLHGEWRQTELALESEDLPQVHYYSVEDVAELHRLLEPKRYHAVVANPPYIVPKDKALNDSYRKRYLSCYKQYSLAVPFMEQIFNLAVEGGFTGQITANSFMKREFGKKLIESFFPTVDLTHVIDTSGAYIPGHGTPTVILFGRNRQAVSSEIRTVMGIKGEPSTPEDPAKGLVWSAIVNQVDVSGSQSNFISVANSDRNAFCKHPWSIGGGGAAELKELLDISTNISLESLVDAIGRTNVVGEDDIWIMDTASIQRHLLSNRSIPFCIGDCVRDWRLTGLPMALYPYKSLAGDPIDQGEVTVFKYLWSFRHILQSRTVFSRTLAEAGRPWWEHLEHYRDKLRTPLSIAFASVASHNHFVLDQGGKVFKQSSPVIKLPANSTEHDYLALLGLLNSSLACFWMKQVFYPKGGDYVGSEGARVRKTLWDERYDFAGTGLQPLPMPKNYPTELAEKLDKLSLQLSKAAPEKLLRNHSAELANHLSKHYEQWKITISTMIALQEELDWKCYQLYDLSNEDLTCKGDVPPIQLGQRAFEIVMARKMAAGELETTWFDRHNSKPITELPDHWSEDYKQLVNRRIELIKQNRNIALIEQPEYKRRWNTEPWESQLDRALQNWLLDRLESYFDFDGRMNDDRIPTAKLSDFTIISTTKLVDLASQDPDFLQVASLYRNDPNFNLQKLIDDLIDSQTVPLLPILRYKPTGLRKRQEWEHTWDKQRQEDAIDARTQLPKDHPDSLDLNQAKTEKAKLGTIPVPPKYTSADFLKSHYWKLRGKLDVPKERWISFPYAEGNDGKPAIAWAGYNHLQLTQAITTYYVEIQETLGGSEDPRLVPLLSCLVELLPWLKQWHSEIDPDYGMAMSDYYENFLQDEARRLNFTIEDLRNWEPPKRSTRKK